MKFGIKKAPKPVVNIERQNLKWASKLVLEAERWNLTSIYITLLNAEFEVHAGL